MMLALSAQKVFITKASVHFERLRIRTGVDWILVGILVDLSVFQLAVVHNSHILLISRTFF